MSIKTFVIGQMAVNCYFLVDEKTKDTIIIDPGDDANYLSGEIEKEKLHPIAIIATHGHFDHILAALELQLMYKIPFRMNKKDEFLLARMRDSAAHFLGREVVEIPPKVTKELKDGEEVLFAQSSLTVMETPGHTPGSVSLFLPKERIVFVGDLIFAGGGVGRTDFAYSSETNLRKSIQKILTLPNGTKIYPGHGDRTTVSGTICL